MSAFKPLPERFWKKVNKSDGCWEWTASVHHNGYGRIGQGDAKSTLAHRCSYEMHYGSIPDGLYVCHRCDNRRCVRPDHLFLATQSENMLDAGRKGRLKGNTASLNEWRAKRRK